MNKQKTFKIRGEITFTGMIVPAEMKSKTKER